MRIDVEKLKKARETIDSFNRLDLKTVDLYENGILLEISPDVIEEFLFTGLSNISFIDTEFYK